MGKVIELNSVHGAVKMLVEAIFFFVISCVSCARQSGYIVPDALVEAFRPKGFKVSIPHCDGIQSFAFQANINEPFELATAQLSQEVYNRTGDKWIIQNDSVKLNLGDQIFYSIHVVRYNLGYKYDGRLFHVSGKAFKRHAISF